MQLAPGKHRLLKFAEWRGAALPSVWRSSVWLGEEVAVQSHYPEESVPRSNHFVNSARRIC